MLGGVSAGANCWFECCVTDSFGAALEPLRDGLGLLPGSFCPHYDGEERRRPVYRSLVDDGFPAGYAADDDAALHFDGTELREVVAIALGRERLPRRARGRDAHRGASPVRKVAVVTSASGSGEHDRRSRASPTRLDVPFHELDALFWQPNWTEPTPDDFRARVEPIVATDSWVIDGSYQSWIGHLVLGNADVVVWLDLADARLAPAVAPEDRIARQKRARSCGTATASRCGTRSRAANSLVLFALRHYRGRRRRYPERFATYDVVRLRTRPEVERFLSAIAARET